MQQGWSHWADAPSPSLISWVTVLISVKSFILGWRALTSLNRCCSGALQQKIKLEFLGEVSPLVLFVLKPSPSRSYNFIELIFRFLIAYSWHFPSSIAATLGLVPIIDMGSESLTDCGYFYCGKFQVYGKQRWSYHEASYTHSPYSTNANSGPWLSVCCSTCQFNPCLFRANCCELTSSIPETRQKQALKSCGIFTHQLTLTGGLSGTTACGREEQPGSAVFKSF